MYEMRLYQSPPSLGSNPRQKLVTPKLLLWQTVKTLMKRRIKRAISSGLYYLLSIYIYSVTQAIIYNHYLKPRLYAQYTPRCKCTPGV